VAGVPVENPTLKNHAVNVPSRRKKAYLALELGALEEVFFGIVAAGIPLARRS